MKTTLYIAWRSGGAESGRWGPVGRLDHAPSRYRYLYTRGAETLPDFRPFPGMPDLRAVYESAELFPLFANRLLAPSRPEYEAFLTWGGFDPGNPPDPLSLLGVTEGLRQTDSIEVFPCPQPDDAGFYVTKFFLHGVRWMSEAVHERIARLRSAEPLGLMLDIGNSHDPYAVAVRTLDTIGRLIIGYVPRYLAKDVWELCVLNGPHPVRLRVERVNSDAPLQQRVLCRMDAHWPDGFHPCNREEFQPILPTAEGDPA